MVYKTIHYTCGCLRQYKSSGTINHVYCGNKYCTFDPMGLQLKHKPDTAYRYNRKQ